MKKNFFGILILMFTLLPPQSTQANKGTEVQEILSVAKMTGACGILDSMINFQKSTKMNGGDDFVARFWSVEAARLGMSVQALSEQCDKSLLMYNHIWNVSSQEK